MGSAGEGQGGRYGAAYLHNMSSVHQAVPVTGGGQEPLFYELVEELEGDSGVEC